MKFNVEKYCEITPITITVHPDTTKKIKILLVKTVVYSVVGAGVILYAADRFLPAPAKTDI